MWCTSATTTRTLRSHLWRAAGDFGRPANPEARTPTPSREMREIRVIQATKKWPQKVSLGGNDSTKTSIWSKEVEIKIAPETQNGCFSFSGVQGTMLLPQLLRLAPSCFFRFFFDLKGHDSRCFKTRNLRANRQGETNTSHEMRNQTSKDSAR